MVAPSAEDALAIYIDANTRIQILDTVSHLPKAEKEQCGAFLVGCVRASSSPYFSPPH